MKRDLDLVRRILLEVEDADDKVDINDLATPQHAMPEIAYHVQLMAHHGLIDARIVYADDHDYIGWVTALTWDGCDYLDAIRNDGVWRKTKEAVKEAVGTTTLAVVKQVAEKVAVELIMPAFGVM